MKAMFWTLLLAASLGTCGTRNANSTPVVELLALEDPQTPETVVFD